MTDTDFPIDPMDYYDEYTEWLMANAEIYICDGDDLIRHFEAGTRFDEFLASRRDIQKPQAA